MNHLGYQLQEDESELIIETYVQALAKAGQVMDPFKFNSTMFFFGVF